MISKSTHEIFVSQCLTLLSDILLLLHPHFVTSSYSYDPRILIMLTVRVDVGRHLDTRCRLVCLFDFLFLLCLLWWRRVALLRPSMSDTQSFTFTKLNKIRLEIISSIQFRIFCTNLFTWSEKCASTYSISPYGPLISVLWSISLQLHCSFVCRLATTTVSNVARSKINLIIFF